MEWLHMCAVTTENGNTSVVTVQFPLEQAYMNI